MKTLLVLTLTFVLSGCGEGGRNPQEVSNGWGSAEVREIALSDGTPCAVVIGAFKGAISCGWHVQ